jgi:hypothetical protein
MSTLAMGDNAELVVKVIRKTLESVGVEVRVLITEAKSREGEMRTQIEQRTATIGELERRIEAERSAITDLESELALTGRTRDGLERSEAKERQLPPLPRPTPPSGPPPARPPLPTPARDKRASDRPTVIAVPPSLGGAAGAGDARGARAGGGAGEPRAALISDSDIESMPPSEPKWPRKASKPPEK